MNTEIRRKRALLILIIWCLLTALSLRNMQIFYYPEDSRRYISIRLSLEGAWQEQIESQLIAPLEGELRMLEGLNEIRSYSGNEKGRILLTLGVKADADEIRLRVQEITERIPLPPRAQRPVIETGDSSSMPVFVVMLEDREHNGLNATDLKSAFAAVRGCGRIDTGGTGKKDLILRIPEENLRSLGMSPDDAVAGLRDLNTPVLIPLKASSALSLDGRFSSPSDAGTVRVNRNLKINDLGLVWAESSDSESISRLNGEKKTLIWIQESGEANTISLCRRLRDVSEKQEGLSIIYDRGHLIEQALKEVLQTLALSAAAVAFVTAILVRETFPVLLLTLNLPCSLGGSLALFRIMGWEIDILSLAGLALSAGMIIDAGIIYLETGYLRARGPVVSSLMSTLLVFLVFLFAPPSLMIPCRSLIRASSSSLILSVLYIRSVMHGILDLNTPAEHQRKLKVKLPHPGLCVGVLGILTLLSLPAASSLEIRQTVKLPDPTLSFTLEYPAGIPKEDLLLRLKTFEKSILDECSLVSSSYKDEKASFQLHPLPGKDKEELKSLLRERLKDEDAYLHFPAENEKTGYTVMLFARDRELLYGESEKLSEILSGEFPDESIVLHYKRRLPLICLKLKPTYPEGPAASEIYRRLSGLLSSPVLAKWYPPGEYEDQSIYDIRVMDPGRNNSRNNSIRELTDLQINAYPPLKDFTEIIRIRDYGTVEHFGGRRSVSFTLFSSEKSEKQIRTRLIKVLKENPFPGGLRLSHGEELKEKRNFRKTAFALLLLALVLLFLLLTAVFEGLKLPFLLLFQLLLTELFTTAFLAILGIPLSAPVLFALVLNGGLSVNNGLLVFAPFRKGIVPKLSEARNSLENCSISLLSAALTTAAGLIPLLFGNRDSGGMLPSLSLTVGIGLFFSLFVLALIVPLLSKN